MRVGSMRARVERTSRASPRARRAVETRAVRGAKRVEWMRAPVSWLERVVVVPASEASVVREGRYCDWTLDARDALEVYAYRGGLVTCAMACVGAAAAHAAGRFQVAEYAAACADVALGASLALVHVYVKPIKDSMRALWAVGSLGVAWIAVFGDAPLTEYVCAHRESMLAVGWTFAAFTGLAFKEGMCYGKTEAGALFFAVPIMCLSHLFGASEDARATALAVNLALLSVFAARKFTQELHADVGDKSVFMFQAMSEAEREVFLAQARASGRDVWD